MTKLTIRAFFFNAQTDYLPYYKNFAIKIEKEKTVLDILTMIKAQNSDFSFPNKNIILKINGLVLTADQTVSSVVEKLGTELQIDPALTYRSNNGLILNDDDFMQSFELLSEFTNDEDKAYFESLYTIHYASASFEYNHEYIGDAVLLLASKLIERASSEDQIKDIIDAINDEFNGLSYCEYENNLFNTQEHTKTIEALKSKVLINKTKESLLNKLCSLTIKPKVYALENETINERNIALYLGDRNSQDIKKSTKEQIQNIGAKFIDFPTSIRVSGQSLTKSNPELAHKKAGKMLLDALDHGADTLLFAKDSDLENFTNIIAKAEKSVGRPIDLQLISLDIFKELSKIEA